MKIFIIFLFFWCIQADDSIKTISYSTCTEPDSFFNSLNCQYFTSYFASVDVIGGGSHTQVLDFVGNPVETTLLINDKIDGATVCPDGVGCTNLNPEIKISIVRSPLPNSTMKVIPGSNISFGLAYSLTLDTDVTKSGLPYAYQIFEDTVANLATTTTCGSNVATEITFQQQIPGSDTQPNCGVGSTIDLRGTCGALAPEPTGWLDDNSGNPNYQCNEICCGDSESVRIRQVAPYCYAYKASGIPILVVDFLIVIESSAVSGGNVSIPVYGSINIGDSIDVESNGVRVTVLASNTIPTNLLENTVSNGWVIFCGSDPTSAIPDEISPVSNVSTVPWFFQPSDYAPYYGDQTNGQGKTTIPVSNDPHTETYGMSGDDVMILATNFMNQNSMSVLDCSDLLGVIPNVPGYDTDNPITPASIYNLPSYCSMWHEARSGNLAFLPPASDVNQFNWMVKKNIGSVGNSNPENGQSYIIFFPTQEQIEESAYESSLYDAIQLQIDFAVGSNTVFPFVTNYGDVTLPVEIIQPNSLYPGTINVPLSVPNCYFQYPLETGGNHDGGGVMTLMLASTLSDEYVQTQNIQQPVSDITVSIACSGVVHSGLDNETPVITVTSDSSVTIDSLGYGKVSPLISFNLSAHFDSVYEKVAIKDAAIANCVITVVYNADNVDKGSFSESFQCKVSNYIDKISNTISNQCSFIDISCHDPIWKSGMLWVSIICGLILLCIIGVIIYRTVLYVQQSKKTQQADEEYTLRENRMNELKRKISEKKSKEQIDVLESFIQK